MVSFSNHPYKLLVVGDTGVGKTAFSSVNSKLNSEEWYIDLGSYKVSKIVINLNGEQIKLMICDMSSAECDRSIRRSFYKVVDGIFILYDSTNRKSFQNLNKWLHEINNHGAKHVTKLIIRNKCDLARQKAVGFHEAREYGIQSNISMFEVSPQDRTNVKSALEHMILKIRSNLKLTNNDEPDHDREEIVLKFVPYISDIGSNAVEQHVNEQGLHDNTENENDRISAEESDDATHTGNVDEREMERAQIPSSHNRAVEEKAKQPNVFSVSKTLKRIFSRKKTIN
ncbi:unnamed protein product [Adineta steineri]|uniref:Uncharacterized protein n=1 Tax=Adineta steineri TaxID=433720 RepID=A0A814EIW8_9BILA|nr:unnamed protein product [Adineta steineri]CAF1037077.1 unnamed protein product [Adineta steineri]